MEIARYIIEAVRNKSLAYALGLSGIGFFLLIKSEVLGPSAVWHPYMAPSLIVGVLFIARPTAAIIGTVIVEWWENKQAAQALLNVPQELLEWTEVHTLTMNSLQVSNMTLSYALSLQEAGVGRVETINELTGVTHILVLTRFAAHAIRTNGLVKARLEESKQKRAKT